LISIDSIITTGDTRVYRISNADGKTWLLPASDLTVGLELYQPSGIKGRLLKKLLPSLHRIPGVIKGIHATCEHIGLRHDIIAAAENAFGVKGLTFSVFGGTPSVHQKITIQFSHGKRILGYCKLTDSDAIRQLFLHEQRLLNHLSESGLEDIPRCLTCDTLPDGTSIFIQSTVKTGRSYSPHHWTPLHESFLQRLSRLTLSTLQFEDTDLHASLLALHENLNRIPPQFRDIIEPRLRQILDEKTGTQVEYSAFHADFTPWNMIIQDNRLFVFDWEYGRLTYPPLLDRYHFFTQQALHVTKMSPRQIHSQISILPWYSPEDYTIYLLDIISRFTLRESGKLPSSLLSMLSSWTEILQCI